MILSIAELRDQIQIAKKQLVASIEIWLNTQTDSINAHERGYWLNVFNSGDREQMLSLLREKALPIERYDSILKNSYPDSSAQESIKTVEFSGSVYLHTHEDVRFKQLAVLATLMDQLHILDDLIAPIVTSISFRPLNLAHTMALSIMNEWRFVEKGVETVTFYRQRLDITKRLLEHEQKNNSATFELSYAQLQDKVIQFKETLKFFSQTLNEAYAEVKDDRYYFIQLFSDYLPWHKILNKLALNIFDYSGVTFNNTELRIEESKLIEINKLCVDDLKRPIDTLKKEHLEISDSVELVLKAMEIKLQAMSSQLEISRRFMERQVMGVLTMPTLVVGLYGFFQGLRAVGGQNPILFNNQQEQVSVEESSIDEDNSYGMQ